jgi:hypothetical protein
VGCACLLELFFFAKCSMSILEFVVVKIFGSISNGECVRVLFVEFEVEVLDFHLVRLCFVLCLGFGRE